MMIRFRMSGRKKHDILTFDRLAQAAVLEIIPSRVLALICATLESHSTTSCGNAS